MNLCCCCSLLSVRLWLGCERRSIEKRSSALLPLAEASSFSVLSPSSDLCTGGGFSGETFTKEQRERRNHSGNRHFNYLFIRLHNAISLIGSTTIQKVSPFPLYDYRYRTVCPRLRWRQIQVPPRDERFSF